MPKYWHNWHNLIDFLTKIGFFYSFCTKFCKASTFSGFVKNSGNRNCKTCDDSTCNVFSHTINIRLKIDLIVRLHEQILLDGLLIRVYNPIFDDAMRGIIFFFIVLSVFCVFLDNISTTKSGAGNRTCSSVKASDFSLLKKTISGS